MRDDQHQLEPAPVPGTRHHLLRGSGHRGGESGQVQCIVYTLSTHYLDTIYTLSTDYLQTIYTDHESVQLAAVPAVEVAVGGRLGLGQAGHALLAANTWTGRRRSEYRDEPLLHPDLGVCEPGTRSSWAA